MATLPTCLTQDLRPDPHAAKHGLHTEIAESSRPTRHEGLCLTPHACITWRGEVNVTDSTNPKLRFTGQTWLSIDMRNENRKKSNILPNCSSGLATGTSPQNCFSYSLIRHLSMNWKLGPQPFSSLQSSSASSSPPPHLATM